VFLEVANVNLLEVGKTISAASREKISAAISALQALLTTDGDMATEAESATAATQEAAAPTKSEGDAGNFPASDFHGACRHCGYGVKGQLKESAACPFCWNAA